MRWNPYLALLKTPRICGWVGQRKNLNEEGSKEESRTIALLKGHSIKTTPNDYIAILLYT